MRSRRSTDIKDKVALVGYGGGAIALQGIARGERFGTVMQMPATEGRLGTEAADRRHPVRHAAAPGVDPLATLPDGGVVTKANVDYLPAARGVAGLRPNPLRSTPWPARRTAASISRSAGSASPSGRPAPSTMSRSPSALARSTPSSARTAPASPRWARSSPASSRRIRATWSCGGRRSSFRSPREALERGIALVAQEVALVPQADRGPERLPRRRTEAGRVHRSRSLRERFDRLRRGRRVRPGRPDRRRTAAPRQAAAGRDPAGAGPRRRPHRPRRAVGEPVRHRGRPAARDRPWPAHARPDGHPRLALPRRGARPADTVTVLRDGRVVRTGRGQRRDGGQPRRRDARPAGQRGPIPDKQACRRPTPGRPRRSTAPVGARCRTTSR